MLRTRLRRFIFGGVPYVDETGDPTLFGSKRGSGVIVGNDGCSKFFIMDKLEVADPDSLAEKLTALRHELLADPYFAGVESFKPGRPKTEHGFHANNDLPEVRYQVFKLLDMMWPQIGEIHDLDHGKHGGTFFKGDDRPTLETVFPRRHEPKKKKPRI